MNLVIQSKVTKRKNKMVVFFYNPSTSEKIALKFALNETLITPADNAIQELKMLISATLQLIAFQWSVSMQRELKLDGSREEYDFAGFFAFSHIRMMGYFWLGKG